MADYYVFKSPLDGHCAVARTGEAGTLGWRRSQLLLLLANRQCAGISAATTPRGGQHDAMPRQLLATDIRS